MREMLQQKSPIAQARKGVKFEDAGTRSQRITICHKGFGGSTTTGSPCWVAAARTKILMSKAHVK